MAWLTFTCCSSCGGSFACACRCKCTIVVAACRRDADMCSGCESVCASRLMFIRFRICELHSFSRRWLKSYGNTMQHIYLSDALLFLCVHLFCDCVRAHLFCVVWIACAFKSVRVVLSGDCFSSLVFVVLQVCNHSASPPGGNQVDGLPPALHCFAQLLKPPFGIIFKT